MFRVSQQLLYKTFFTPIKRFRKRRSKWGQEHISSACYCCMVLTKIEIIRYTLLKLRNSKCHTNPFVGRVVIGGQPDGQQKHIPINKNYKNKAFKRIKTLTNSKIISLVSSKWGSKPLVAIVRAPFTDHCYSTFLLSMSGAPQLSRDIPADAGFLCDKATVLVVTIKVIPPCIISFANTIFQVI